MSVDNNPAADSGEAGDKTTGESQDPIKEFVSLDEFNSVKKRHDDVAGKLRLTEKELKTIKAEVAQKSLKNAEDSGSIEAARAEYQKFLKETEADRDTWKEKFISREKNMLFRKLASEYATEKTFDTSFSLLSNQLELVETDDGKFDLVVTGSPVDAKTFIKNFFAEHDYLAKPKGVGGTGTDGRSKDESRANGLATSLPNNFESLGRDEQMKWFKANPDFRM